MSKIRSTLYLGVSRLITLLASVWALGRYYEWLGEEGWGAIALIVLIGGFLFVICDLGLNNGALNAVVRHMRDKDHEKADRVITSHRIVVVSASLGLSLVFLILFLTQAVQGLGQDSAAILFFVCAAAQFVLGVANVGLNAFLTAAEEFATIARAQMASSFANIGVSLWLVHATREPWGFLMGNVVGATVSLALFEWRIRKLGFFKQPTRYYRDEYQAVLNYVRRSFIGSIALLFEGSDKIVVNATLGQKTLGVYDIATRLPSTLTQTIPIGQVVQPELVKAHLEGEERLTRAYERTMPAALGLVLALLVVPSAFGEQILRILIQDYQAVMFPLFVAASFNSAMMIHGSLFAITCNGAGKPQIAAPFIWLGSLGNGLIAIPAALWYGITGVAVSRACVQGVQFYAMEVAVKKGVLTQLNIGRLFSLKFGIVGIAALFWGAGFALSQWAPIKSQPWAGVAAAMVFSYAFMAVITASKLIDLPVKLLKLFPFLPKPA